MERKNVVTFMGNPLTLLGTQIKAGDKAPDFTLLDKELKEVKLADYAGKTLIISVTPSLDTPVCDLQARTFNKEAQALSSSIVVLNVSMDLPLPSPGSASMRGLTKYTPSPTTGTRASATLTAYSSRNSGSLPAPSSSSTTPARYATRRLSRR